ncbi:MAG: phage tail tape measure protein [Gammaproteobacteria bacterium]
MSDSTLDLAMRITAIDVFSGVLNRFRTQIMGAGAQSKELMRDYDLALSNIRKGFNGLAAAKYGFDKMKPALDNAAKLQQATLAFSQILQGAHPNAKKLADQMQRVSDNAISVARHMKYSAIEVMDVSRLLYKSGIPLAAILDRVGKSGKTIYGLAYYTEALAETQGTTPQETAAQIGNVGHAFRLKPNQYARAINLITQAQPVASGSLTELFHNLAQSGAITKYLSHTSLLSLLAGLKTVAPLGEEGGTDFATMLETFGSMRVRGKKYLQKYGLNFYDKQGQFLGLDKSLDVLRKTIAARHWTPEQINKILGPIFGQQGLKAIALMTAPNAPGVKSYQEIKKSITEQANLSQQRIEWEKGYLAQLSELKTTGQTLSAVLATPVLSPTVGVMKTLNDWMGDFTLAAHHHKSIGIAATAAGGAALAAAVGYSAWNLIKTIKPGSHVLRSLLGKGGGLAARIGEGKLIQKVAGVPSVFVVNMPSGGLPAPAGGIPPGGSRILLPPSFGERGAAIAAGSIAARLKGFLLAPALASISSAKGLKATAGAAGKLVGALGLAASAGWALGKALDRIPAVHSFFDKEFQNSLANAVITAASGANKNAVELTRGAQLERAWRTQHKDFKGAIKITIDSKGKAHVTELRSSTPRVNLSVGHAMSTP